MAAHHHDERPAEDKCPARPNSEEEFATGSEVIGLLENCEDKSKKCGKCSDKCEDAGFSRWMEKNCAKTCGICVDPAEMFMVKNLQDNDNVLCWKLNGGYEYEHIYHSVLFTSMNDCRDLCFADDQCVGVHTTHFDKVPRYCELASGGELTVSVNYPYFFGASRQCLEDHPNPDCTDHWTEMYCSGYKRTCTSNCPTWIRLMHSVCRKTCELCSNEDTDQITWTEIEGKKIGKKKNNVLESDLSLEDAKDACVKWGDECGGLSCKRKKKSNICELLRNIDNYRTHEKYSVYAKNIKM